MLSSWLIFSSEGASEKAGAVHSANGRRQKTRPVQGIDQNIRLNRALWLLADGMRQLKA